MKPARFEYMQADSLEEALELIEDQDRDARLLAGGQSLVPLMNFRLAQPDVLVDINRIVELDFMESDSAGVRIGALRRHAALERASADGLGCSVLTQATRFIGHFQIRNRGTIGGSLAHADPAAEHPTVAVALSAEVEVRSVSDTRLVPAEELFVGPFMTALMPGEMITEVRFPSWANAGSFKELARRSGDFAVAAVAVALALRDDGEITRAGIAVGGAGPTPLRMREAESILVERGASDEALHDAARAAAAATQPSTDVHGTADYRRGLAEVLTLDALREATTGRVNGQ